MKLFKSTPIKIMGEKIRDLSQAQFKGSSLKIELNQPTVQGQDQQVHLQSETGRLELDRKDYVQLAMSILSARDQLKRLKNIQ